MFLFFMNGVGGANPIREPSKIDGDIDTLANINRSKEQFRVNDRDYSDSNISKMQAVMISEHEHAKKSASLNSVKQKQVTMQSHVQKLQQISKDPSFQNIVKQQGHYDVLKDAKKLYVESKSFALANGAPIKETTGSGGANSILEFVNGAQQNYNSAVNKMSENKTPSLAQMMNYSNKMNDASSRMYMIMTAVKSLVDGVNKLGNAQI